MIVRRAIPADVPAMTALQNAIIRRGGTTAHEVERTDAEVRAAYIDGPTVLCCHVAENAGRILGFQVLGRYPGLLEGWGELGTFVDVTLQRGGVGVALFAATVEAARGFGLLTLDATIRADNAAGLGYYSRRGFVDYAVEPDFALRDGRVVGRIRKRFDLD